jgi:hypothetical protein
MKMRPYNFHMLDLRPMTNAQARTIANRRLSIIAALALGCVLYALIAFPI